MDQIEKLLKDSEQGRWAGAGLLQALGVTATTAVAPGALPKALAAFGGRAAAAGQ